ncbi:hypothetical protein [Xanthomonas medicagonis]|uniref:hypothetical protein n=1 Tax=Xanthomonas medicagonis TaxID=3160841 RepID=UPI003516D39D
MAPLDLDQPERGPDSPPVGTTSIWTIGEWPTRTAGGRDAMAARIAHIPGIGTIQAAPPWADSVA